MAFFFSFLFLESLIFWSFPFLVLDILLWNLWVSILLYLFFFLCVWFIFFSDLDGFSLNMCWLFLLLSFLDMTPSYGCTRCDLVNCHIGTKVCTIELYEVLIFLLLFVFSFLFLWLWFGWLSYWNQSMPWRNIWKIWSPWLQWLNFSVRKFISDWGNKKLWFLCFPIVRCDFLSVLSKLSTAPRLFLSSSLIVILLSFQLSHSFWLLINWGFDLHVYCLFWCP